VAECRISKPEVTGSNTTHDNFLFFLEVTLVIHIYSTLVNYTDIQKGLLQFLALFELYNQVSSFSLGDELFFILVVMYFVKTSHFFLYEGYG
jgi:hypothetical protein